MHFAHLHLHSDHSFLDGVGKSIEYAELAARHKHAALAITDHGNLHGFPEHRRACVKYGVRPIYGCELYANDERDATKEIKTRARDEKIDKAAIDPTFTDSHLVVLCESDAGFKNLLKINHDSVRNGFYYKPRTTHAIVCQHAEGLFASTACINSIFSKLALRGDIPKLDYWLKRFKDAFGDRFYREVHVNPLLGGHDAEGRPIPDQRKANAILSDRCKRLGVPPVLVNDVHYACRGDDHRQDEMTAIAHHYKVGDKGALRLTARDLWFANPRDLYELQLKWGYGYDRGEIADWCARSAEIAERCRADIYGDGKPCPPKYKDDNGNECADGLAMLRKLAVEGYRRRCRDLADSTKYRDRLNYEVKVVAKLGLADFFLVTWDVVQFCKSKGIRVWTRGSGCASLLAAVLGITSIDPLRFGLLFERFMDPDRPTPPDFDLDIDSSRREEVIDWLIRKYGGDDGDRIARVCAIQTYGLRSAIRDVLGTRGVEPSIAGRLAAATEHMEPAVGFPVPKAEIVIADADTTTRADAVRAAYDDLVARCSPDLRAWCDSNRQLVFDALTMVGRARGKTLHAAGFVVAPGPLHDYIPIDRATSEAKQKVITTAWTEGQSSQDIAPTGLMKIDCLGLETVAVVDAAVRLATRRTGNDVESEVDGWTIDYADAPTIAELRSGNGIGLHQLNSQDQALAGFLRDLRPTGVDDLVAAVAAYRPGSLEHLDEFVARSRGRSGTPKVSADFDAIASDTKGVLIYQEQIMLILNRMGGIPLREAYGVIKAVSKKQQGTIEKSRDKFLMHATRKVDPATAKRVWDDVMRFAGYGFNKCVSADTVLSIADGGSMTVVEAYRAFRSKTALGKKMRAGRWRVLQMDDDGRVRPGRVKAVHDNGVAFSWIITFKPIGDATTRGTIRATRNHRLMTDIGYEFVRDLKPGDKIVAMGGKSSYVPRESLGVVRGDGATYSGCGFRRGKGNVGYIDGRSVCLNRARAEAALRASDGRCEQCRRKVERMELAHTRSFEECGGKWDVYHSSANVRMLCNPCHKTFDYAKGERVPAWTRGRGTNLVEVVSVEPYRDERVYDIEMDTVGRNYVANGIVSHNSHAASYGVLGYITAYLRAHYPLEFWWAWLSRMPNTNKGKGQDKTRRCEPFMRGARARGITLLPPVVGASTSQWRITKTGKLLAPLSLIVGIGEAAADTIASTYRLSKWANVWDFLAWVESHGRVVTSKSLTALAQGGALSRWCSLGEAVDIAAVYAEAKASKAKGTRTEQARDAIVNHAKQYRLTLDSEELAAVNERHAFGFSFWNDAWERNNRRASAILLAEQGRIAPDDRSHDRLRGKRRAYCIRSLRTHTDKNGNEMAFADLEGPTGRSVRGVVFSKVWKRATMQVDRVYLCRGEFSSDGAYLFDGSTPTVDIDEARIV